MENKFSLLLSSAIAMSFCAQAFCEVDAPEQSVQQADTADQSDKVERAKMAEQAKQQQVIDTDGRPVCIMNAAGLLDPDMVAAGIRPSKSCLYRTLDLKIFQKVVGGYLVNVGNYLQEGTGRWRHNKKFDVAFVKTSALHARGEFPSIYSSWYGKYKYTSLDGFEKEVLAFKAYAPTGHMYLGSKVDGQNLSDAGSSRKGARVVDLTNTVNERSLSGVCEIMKNQPELEVVKIFDKKPYFALVFRTSYTPLMYFGKDGYQEIECSSRDASATP